MAKFIMKYKGNNVVTRFGTHEVGMNFVEN